MDWAASLRRVFTIAYAESRRTTLSFDRKQTITLLVLALVASIVTPAIMSSGFDFDQGLYRVAHDGQHPVLPAVAASPLFRLVESSDPRAALQAGEADLALLRPDNILAPDSEKGRAALDALEQAVKDHTYGQLLGEADQAAAFPVRVEVMYEQQARRAGGGGATPSLPSGLEPPSTSGDDGGGTSGASSSGGTSGASSTGADAPADSRSSSFEFLPAQRSVNTPESLSPPFPFRSLLLAYAFLIPMNFIVQVYAGSAIAERLDRKGEPLLASPARPWEIVTGKALPYFLLMMLVSSGIVLWVGGGWLSLLAIAPLALTFLALEFVAAMYARSFRELTFLTVFASVLLTIYAFLPAVFSDVHPIALVSPITLVVFDLRDTAVAWGDILYSLAPLTLFSAVSFILGTALYREEDMFHQKRVVAKAVDSLARQVRGLGSAIKLPLMLLPFVLIAELLLATFLFSWPVPTGVVGILFAVALTEETFKAAPSYAGVRRGAIPAKRALVFGMLVGVGFWLAEKAFLLVSIAGLGDVDAGATVLGETNVLASGAPPLALFLLLLAPLALHVVTAGITGWAAQHDKRTFAASFFTAVAIHTLYNLVVLTWVGGMPF